MSKRTIGRAKRLGALALLTGAVAAAYAAAGILDATFGTGGVVRTAGNQVFDAVVQSDGKIVVSGVIPDSVPQGTSVPWTLRRYDAAGALDTTFGSGGAVSLFGTGGAIDIARDLAIDSGGRILAVGTVKATVTSGSGKKQTTSTVNYATVARLSASGSLDSSFGSGGSRSIAVPNTDASSGREVVEQSDGKLLVGGNTYYTGNLQGYGRSELQAPFVARLNSNGSLDTSFATGGFIVGSGSFNGGVRSIALQSDGKIVVLTSAYSGTAFTEQIARYMPSGAVDATFATIQPSDQILQLAVDSSDRIVGIGYRSVPSGTDMLCVRYTANGAVDTTFAGGLGATVDYGASDDAGVGPFVQADGKIVFSGTGAPTAGASVILTVRLNNDGSRDTSFGTNGVATPISLGSTSNFVNGGSLGPDGKTVICGGTFDRYGDGSYAYEWLVARYLGN